MVISPYRMEGKITLRLFITARKDITEQLAIKEFSRGRYKAESEAIMAHSKKLMQLWVDYLDKLKTGAEVIPINGKAA